MYKNFRGGTLKKKEKKKICATHLVELMGAKLVAYGRTKIMMLLLSYRKELSPGLDRNNPNLKFWRQNPATGQSPFPVLAN